MDVVCTTGFLGSLLCFMLAKAAQERPPYRTRASFGFALLSWLCFAGAILVKEMGVTLPGIIIVYDVIFSTPRKSFYATLWQRVKQYAPYFLILAGYSLLRAHALARNAQYYDSPLRSVIGGYAVEFFGSFIFENIVWYFKFLAIPFDAHLFSPSLLLNVLGITVITVLCLVLSKESRFGILWIFVTLIPVYSFHIGRGVYLASVGFCMLISMLFTFRLADRIKHKTMQNLMPKILRVSQVIIVLVLFYRYGIALQKSNAWWSDVAEISEQVPLMTKAIYPELPKGAYTCFQNLPLDMNQRFLGALYFRYPHSQLGVYTEDFEQYLAQKGTEHLPTAYFFLYDRQAKVLYDLTYETRDAFLSPYTQYKDRLERYPLRKLSQQTPQLTFEFKGTAPCSAIGIVTSLANGIEVPQGTILARGQIQGENSFVEQFELIAGQDTAEWAFRFPTIQNQVQHQTPKQVFRAWTVQQPDKTYAVAQNYLKRIQFQTPVIPVNLSVTLVMSPGVSADLLIDIDRVIFYTTEAKGQK